MGGSRQMPSDKPARRYLECLCRFADKYGRYSTSMTTFRQHRASFVRPAIPAPLHHPLPFHQLQFLLPFTHLYRVWRIGYFTGAPWLLLAQSLRLLPKYYHCHLLVRFLQHWLPVFAAGKTFETDITTSHPYPSSRWSAGQKESAASEERLLRCDSFALPQVACLLIVI